LLSSIRELHAVNYHVYGYRRMWKALRRAGEQVSRCRVQRLMRSNGIQGAKRRGKPRRTWRTDLVLDALEMALGRRRAGADVALIHHSDRGSQYTSIDYTQTLDDHRVLASAGSVGDAYDNVLAESFVDSFKTELIADRVWRSRSQLELAVVEYIGWYYAARLHQSLGHIPPAEYEQRHAPEQTITLAGAAV
jgi:transposase InsO family protein